MSRTEWAELSASARTAGAPALLRSKLAAELLVGRDETRRILAVEQVEEPRSSSTIDWVATQNSLEFVSSLAARGAGSSALAGAAGNALLTASSALFAASKRAQGLATITEGYRYVAQKGGRDGASLRQCDERLAMALGGLGGEADRLDPGSSIVVPAGWCEADGSGHVVLLVVKRGGSNADGFGGAHADFFGVAVVNCGLDADGACFHAQRFDRAQRAERQRALVLRAVPRQRLAHAAAWFVLLRPLALAHGHEAWRGTSSLWAESPDGAAAAQSGKPWVLERLANEAGLGGARRFYEGALTYLGDDEAVRGEADAAAQGWGPGGVVATAVEALVYVCRSRAVDARACALALQLACLDCMAAQLEDFGLVGLDDGDAALAKLAARRVCADVARAQLALPAAARAAPLRAAVVLQAQAAARRIDAYLAARALKLQALRQLRADDLGGPGPASLRFGPLQACAQSFHSLKSDDGPSMLDKAAALVGAGSNGAAVKDEAYARLLIKLAGAARHEPLVLPIDVSSASFPLEPGAHAVDTIAAAATAMRRADETCSLMDNQREFVPGSAARRFAVVAHLFLRALPCPRPPDEVLQEDTRIHCFWRDEAMRRETQRDLLALLRRLALHVRASSASIKATRALDGERILTLAAIAAVADAVTRSIACDEPSLLSLFYSGCFGDAKHAILGDTKNGSSPFGFNLRFFAAETGRALLPDPGLVASRSCLLDYFEAVQRIVPKKNVLFRWERGFAVSRGDARLLERLCVAMAYPRGQMGAWLPAYLTGERPGLVDQLPELAMLRDVVFILKLAMAPADAAATGIKTSATVEFSVSNAAPRWRLVGPAGGDDRPRRQARREKYPRNIADACTVRVAVSTFGLELGAMPGFPDAEDEEADRYLDGADEAEDDYDTAGKKPGALGAAWASIRAALAGAVKPRVAPSAADPSHLAGEIVASEDDVLHLKKMPMDLGQAPPAEDGAFEHDSSGAAKVAARLAQFGGGSRAAHASLPPRDVERLLCYLTAPYIRLPLVLRFFAEPRNVRFLRDERLRDCLEAVLFEPGPWAPRGFYAQVCDVSVIPAPHRQHLRAPAGALANELALSPEPTLDAINKLLDLAMELDVGRWAPASELILFAARTAARLCSFARAVATSATPEAITKNGGRGLHASLAATGARGFSDAPNASKDMCTQAAAALRRKLLDVVAPALRGWLEQLVGRASTDRASATHATLAYIYAKTAADVDLDFAKAVLSAQCFLAAYSDRRAADGYEAHDVAMPDANAATRKYRVTLGVSDAELQGVWQSCRSPLLTWLQVNLAGKGAEALEAVVSAVTAIDADPDSVASQGTVRKWVELRSHHGRFTPQRTDIDDAAAKKAAAEDDAAGDDDDYEARLRARILRETSLEIVDVQLGEFTLRRNRLQALPARVRADRDLCAALGCDSLQAAELRAAEALHCENARRWRLVAQRVDVVHWAAPNSDLPPPFELRFGYRLLSSLVGGGEQWVAAFLAGARFKAELGDDAELHVRGHPADIAGSAAVAVVAFTPATQRWREVWVRRRPLKIVEIYEVTEHARGWYRSLTYSSWPSFSLASLKAAPPKAAADEAPAPAPPKKSGHGHGHKEWLMPSFGFGSSLEISRTAERRGAKTQTKQTYVPRRLLRGALPDALLDAHEFWRNDDDASVCGYGDETVVVVDFAGAPHDPAATVRRYQLVDRADADGAAEDDADVALPENLEDRSVLRGSGLVLVRLGGACFGRELAGACATEDDGVVFVQTLASKLARLDALSHVLLWLRDDPKGPKKRGKNLRCDRLELPRLGLTFVADHSAARNGVPLFRSMEHVGMCLADAACLHAEDDMDEAGDAARLVDSLPAALLLAGDDRAQSKAKVRLVVSARNKPKRAASAALLACTTVSDHDDASWVVHSEHEVDDDGAGRSGHFSYDLDRLAAALVPESAAAAVHLVLLLCCARRYASAAALARCCVTDEARPRSVDAALAALGSICAGDADADAHACRLQLYLATLDVGCDAFVPSEMWPWDASTELALYVHKRKHVSRSCALSVADERLLFERTSPPCATHRLLDAPLRLELANRRATLLDGGADGVAAIAEPPTLGFSSQWVERWSVLQAKSSARPLASLGFYSRPVGFEEWSTESGEPASMRLQGDVAVAWLRTAFARGGLDPNAVGASAKGRPVTRHFGAIYELLTLSLPLKVSDGDGPFGWGAALLHVTLTTALKSAEIADSADEFLAASTLYGLVSQPNIVQTLKLQTYKPAPKPKTMMDSLSSSTAHDLKVLTQLCKGAADGLRLMDKRGEIDVLEPRERTAQVTNHATFADRKAPWCFPLDGMLADDDADDAFGSPAAAEHAAANDPSKSTCSLDLARRGLGGEARPWLLESLVEMPLGAKLLDEFTRLSREDASTLSAGVPYTVHAKAVRGEPTAEAYVQRLEVAAAEDLAKRRMLTKPHLRDFGDVNDPKKAAYTAADLREALGAVARADAEAGRLARLALVGLANRDAGAGADAAARWCAFEGRLQHRGGLGDVLRASSGIGYRGAAPAADVASVACVVALLEARAVHARRCETAALRIEHHAAALAKTGAAPNEWAELILEADVLAELLWAKREHFAKTAPETYLYDARLLFAEHALGLQLRASQMIMGSGKTTVLTPTLVALLADGTRLVTVVVPTALVVFTRETLRRSLATATLGYRPVRSLRFGRRSRVNRGLLQRLTACAASRGVVLADPTSVKALFLKSIEVMHRLDEAERFDRDAAVESNAALKLKKSQSTFSSMFGSTKARERAQRNAEALGVVGQAEAAGQLVEVAKQPFQQLDAEETQLLRDEAEMAFEVLSLLKRGAALLDEVDLVLHPLKSELNWPLGEKAPLDFTLGTQPAGLRWRVPHVLFDAFFLSFEDEKAAAAPAPKKQAADKASLAMPRALGNDVDDYAADSDDENDDNIDDDEINIDFDDAGDIDANDDEGISALRLLKALKDRIGEIVRFGVTAGAVQLRPHPTLVSEKWYHAELRPALTDWALKLLRAPTREAVAAGAAAAGDLGGLDDEVLRAYLMGGDAEGAKAVDDHLTDDQAKVLNLYRTWLQHLLPFSLARTNRVSYGLLSAAEIQRATSNFRKSEARQADEADRTASAGAEVSKKSNKRVAAVPKARRLLAVPFVGKDRPSDASEFSHPDVLIGMTTLAVRHEGLRWTDLLWLLRDLQKRLQDESGPFVKRSAYKTFARYVHGAGAVIRGEENDAELAEVWPLQLVDLDDASQVKPLFGLLQFSQLAGRDYLWRRAFPETLALRPSKLAASGQELGGDAIFGARLGFSGTPNDLVPAELGLCVFEAATDGQVARTLADETIVGKHAVEAGWTPEALLEHIALSAHAPGGVQYSALIDAGALITGLSNLEVALKLLESPRHLQHVDGVLFLDEEDRPLVALRRRRSVVIVPEHECGLAPERRFTFYDHAHCTGLDVKQRVDAVGALTLSKDTTFRDAAQAAYRLRGLGKGQTLVMFLIPELAGCVADATCKQRDDVRARFAEPGWPRGLLPDVLSALAVAAIRIERANFFLLAEQNVLNVARKVGHAELLRHRGSVGSQSDAEGRQWLRHCLDVFRTRVDFGVENAMPKPKPFSERIATHIEENVELMSGSEDFATVQRMLHLVAAAEKLHQPNGAAPKAALAVAGADGQMTAAALTQERVAASFEGMQEQEEEQEQEQEQEIERKCVEEVTRDETDEGDDEPAGVKFVRDDEPPEPWPLVLLTVAPWETATHPFEALDEFKVFRPASSVLKKAPPPAHVAFPRELRFSPNYFRPKWWKSAPRRIKNVAVVLEFDPYADLAVTDDDVADANAGTAALGKDAQERLRRAFMEHSADLEPQDLKARTMLTASSLRGAKGFPTDALPDGCASTCEAFEQTFSRRAVSPRSQGACYVVVSLVEAEHLRGVLHARIRRKMEKRDAPKIPGEVDVVAVEAKSLDDVLDRSGVGLRILGAWDGTGVSDAVDDGVGVVLDSTCQRRTPPAETDAKAMACLEFFDVCDEVSPRHAALLLRALQRTPPQDRIRFRDDVRQCRRRPRNSGVVAASFFNEVFGGGGGGQAQTEAARWSAPSESQLVKTDTDPDDSQLDGGEEDAPTRPAIAVAGPPKAPSMAPMRFAVAALVLDDETILVEWRCALLCIRRMLRKKNAPLGAFYRRVKRASAALRDKSRVSYAAASLFPVTAVASALRWLDPRRDVANTRQLARALDLNADGWIAMDELRCALLDAAAYEKPGNKAPFLPLPQMRPAMALKPPEDDSELDKVLAATSPWRALVLRSLGTRAPKAAGPSLLEIHAAALTEGGPAPPPGAAPAAPTPVKVTDASLDALAEIAKLAAEFKVDDLKGLVARLRVPAALEPVWSSLGTASGTQVSIWRPDETRAASRTSLKICVGHYAVIGVADPLQGLDVDAAEKVAARGEAGDGGKPMCIELSDTYTFRRGRAKWLAAAAERLCPPPLRFKQLWHLPLGDRSVYGWAAIPPSDKFVALGHVATRSPEPPHPRCVRCVPAAWARQLDALAALGAEAAWANASLGGKKGSLWRHLDSALLVVSKGHGPPTQDVALHRLRKAAITCLDYPEVIRHTAAGYVNLLAAAAAAEAAAAGAPRAAAPQDDADAFDPLTGEYVPVSARGTPAAPAPPSPAALSPARPTLPVRPALPTRPPPKDLLTSPASPPQDLLSGPASPPPDLLLPAPPQDLLSGLPPPVLDAAPPPPDDFLGDGFPSPSPQPQSSLDSFAQASTTAVDLDDAFTATIGDAFAAPTEPIAFEATPTETMGDAYARTASETIDDIFAATTTIDDAFEATPTETADALEAAPTETIDDALEATASETTPEASEASPVETDTLAGDSYAAMMNKSFAAADDNLTRM
ncbi:hypothetical protein M885DRAFT_614307 [Pelagophyceae sp. CCMP2097]|nr:hypothetical protein M885DRAFT_614307 [Pelagophyceae sp. CCMP2097]